MRLLYVDDRLIDLKPGQVIAQTLQVFDPGRMGSVVTNYTSSIRIPRTSNNDQIIGHLNNTKTKSNYPYTSLSCRYVENGFPLIRNGRVVVSEVNETGYSLTVYSGPFGFFERIVNRTLWDLDFTDINGPWTQAARDGYRNTNTGIVQALVDDGRLDQNSASTAPTIENQGIVKPPQIYYHTILEKIFETFGFLYEGDIFDNDIFKKLVMPLSLVYNDKAWIEAKSFMAGAPGTQEMTDPVVEETVIFDSGVKQGSEGFYDGISEYVVVNGETANRYYRLLFFSNLTLEVTGGTVDIKIEATGYSPSLLSNVGSGNHTISLLPTNGLKDGDVVKVTIVTNTGSPAVEIVSGTFYTKTIAEDVGDEVFPSIVFEHVYFNKLFENILIVDFLKDFSIRFGCQISQINSTIKVNTLNKILDDNSGPDWTVKRDRIANKIKYAFANYGLTNYFKSPVDTDFTPNLTSNYGDGSFEIPNENLKESTTVYTSMFEVTEMISSYGVFMLNLNLEPTDPAFPQSARMPGKRLFFVRDNYDFEPPVLYDAIDRTDYKVGYYFDPGQNYEMSWQFFLDNFQKKFVERCLRRVRLVEREYNLSDLDIYKFDQQVPIWDNGERFLVTKISNRVSGKICGVQLLKIEPNPKVTYIEHIINASIVDYLETTIGAQSVSDYLETVAAVIENDEPIALLRMELFENVTGNPTWQTTFNNGVDSEVLICLGDFSSGSSSLDVASNISANVLKTNNNGNGPDGFPAATGWVQWLKNGVQVNTATFNSSMPTTSWGLNYTYTGVMAGDVLKVVVRENGTTP
jgi:hypothetical protein